MRVLTVQAFQQCGFSAAADEASQGGCIVDDGQTRYVVLTEARYRELLRATYEAQLAGSQAMETHIESEPIWRDPAEDLFRQLGLVE